MSDAENTDETETTDEDEIRAVLAELNVSSQFHSVDDIAAAVADRLAGKTKAAEADSGDTPAE